MVENCEIVCKWFTNIPKADAFDKWFVVIYCSAIVCLEQKRHFSEVSFWPRKFLFKLRSFLFERKFREGTLANSCGFLTRLTTLLDLAFFLNFCQTLRQISPNLSNFILICPWQLVVNFQTNFSLVFSQVMNYFSVWRVQSIREV